MYQFGKFLLTGITTQRDGTRKIRGWCGDRDWCDGYWLWVDQQGRE